MPLSIALPIVKAPQGVILYEGPSLLDGKKIVVISTNFNGSANPKTGDMIGTWILRADENPYSVYWNGDDATICGDCKHRSTESGGMGTCYVNVAQAPLNIWKAWKNKRYEKPTIGMLAYFKDKMIRLGSYGDPMAVPYNVWSAILKDAKGHTGYTHSWKLPHANEYKDILMASVDNEREAIVARSKGWRTFRVRVDGEPLMSKEFVCPASIEGGNRLTCETCGACNGGSFNHDETGKFKAGRGTVAIIVHGRGYKIDRFKEAMKAGG